MTQSIVDSQPAGSSHRRAYNSLQADTSRSEPPLHTVSVRLETHDVARHRSTAGHSTADVNQRFGSRLRTLRYEHQLTQQTMAQQFGIDRSFISDMERGKKSVSLVTLEVLALGFGVTVSQLLADV